METDKKLLVFCEQETTDLIHDAAAGFGIDLIIAEDGLDFTLKLSESPEAIFISPELVDNSILASLSFYKTNEKNVRIAAVVDQNASQDISNLLKFNISNFFTKDNIKDKLSEFIEIVSISNRKPDILVRTIAKLKKLVGNLYEGVIVFDSKRRATYVNKSAENILKLSSKDIIKKELNEIFKEHPITEDKEKMISGFHEESQFITYQNEELTLNCTYSKIMDDTGDESSMLIFTKVTPYAIDRQKEIELLKYKERYHSLQQSHAFKKQMLVLKDEVSNTILGDYCVETYFRPLDILSGDFYGSINIKDGRYLFYIIDAMGKGLSASVTAIQSSSFINHSVELSIIKDDFDMNKMLSSFLHYIKDRLLDEEALCAAFAILDSNTNTINIANFGMPPLLMQNSKGEIIKIANNNLPIMRCVAGRTFRSYSLKNIEKILMMSDGLIEAATKDENLYMDYIDDHFKASLTKKHFLNMVNKTIDSNDDDITFFMFKKACMREFQGQEIVVNTSLDAINDAMQWASDRMDEDQISDIDRSSIEFALTEILMNALEHGNLGIGFNEKQELIATGEYDSYILEHTKEDSPQYTKKISLKYQLKTNLSDDFWLLVLSITDEGNGFTPSNIFKYHSFDGNLCQIDSKSYNGRGIFITDNMVDGLYYNENGNVANIVKVIPAQKK